MKALRRTALAAWRCQPEPVKRRQLTDPKSSVYFQDILGVHQVPALPS